jgi:type VI secretion system protein VasG
LIDDTQKHWERLYAELQVLEREQATGNEHDARLKELKEACAQLEQTLIQYQTRFQQEKALVMQIQQLRALLETGPTDQNNKANKKQAEKFLAEKAQLEKLLQELQALQGETPMVPMQVDGLVVAEIVAAWTGIPLGKMVKNEMSTVLNLKTLLEERVIGQSHALEAVTQRVRTARANLEDPNKPQGVFMFVGPSGVGKTETALALADILYGGERKLITINMSEYQEAHTVSGLKGSPPGYVGYGEGGVLTEAVRRNPYSVLLLDEVEKAHPDVLEMFFQVFDKGIMDDAEGREIDFRNTLIILTSNIGSAQIMQSCLNKAPEELPSVDELEELLRPQLYKAFKPAFLGRMKVVPYYPIADDILVQIIELKLARIKKRVADNHKAEFMWDKALVEAVLSRCTEVDTGARNVDHILNGTLLPEIAQTLLARMAQAEAIRKIKVSVNKQGNFKYNIQ